MTTYNWIIESMQTKPQEGSNTDVVVTAFWRCNGTFADTNGTAYGSCSFPPPDGEFTPYDKLTEAQVLGWVWSSGVDKTEIEANLTRQLDALINPAQIIPPLPWAA